MPRRLKYVRYKDAYDNFSTGTELSVLFASTEEPQAWKIVDYINGPSIRDIYILQYCHSGCGTLTIEDKIYSVKAGQTFVSIPGLVTTMEADYNNPWALTWVCFRGEKVEQYFKMIGIDENNPLFPWNEHTELHEAMLRGKELWEKQEPAREFQLAAYANELFAILVRSCAQHSSASSLSSPHQYISQAINYIDSHLDKRVSVNDIAEHVGLNRTYFSMLFHKETGQTPQEFLIQHRMKKACIFFENPRATVSSVAYSLGYEPHVFSRVFKQTIGKTPQQYKMELHKKTI